MRDSKIKYARSYKLIKHDYENEMVFYSEKTGKKVIVCNRDGWYTGAHYGI